MSIKVKIGRRDESRNNKNTLFKEENIFIFEKMCADK